MVIVMYGAVVLIVLVAVAVAATKDGRLASAFANAKSE